MAAHFATHFFLGAALRLAPPPRFSPIPAATPAAAVLMFTANSRLGYWCAPLCVALLVIGTVRVSATPSRWVTRWGDLSYGLYLYAFPVQQLVISTGFARTIPGAPSSSPGWGSSDLSWRWIESPALRFKPRARPAAGA